MHPKKNDEAHVSLKAFDKQGELVDTMNTFSRLSPELQYIEFAHKARTRYRAVRIVMEVAYLVMLCIFLSSGTAEATNGSYKGSCGGFNCNPFVGYSLDITLERDFPEEGTSAVPFATFNISKELNGWHDLSEFQIMMEKREAVYATLRPSKLNDDYWSLLTPIGKTALLIGLWLLLFGLLYWSDTQLAKQVEVDKERSV